MLPALPDSFRWADDESASHLYFNYSGVATIRVDGDGCSVRIKWNGREIKGRAASIAQGKLHVSRFVAARVWRHVVR